MDLWRTEQVDVKVCLFAFEIKELSQAEAARL
jgi:hypothetical protein